MRLKITTTALVGVLSLGSLLFGASAGFASSHGNDLVHARKLGGQVFMMNQLHMSLYMYDNDGLGVSNCYDACAEAWPPALLDANANMPENYTLFERSDGTMQIAFKGQPLYLWSGDQKIGDISGDGVGGVWHLARP